MVGQVVSYHQGVPIPWAHPLEGPSPSPVDPMIQEVVAFLGILEALVAQAFLKASEVQVWVASVLPLNPEGGQGALDGSLGEQEEEEACPQEGEQEAEA